MQTFLNSPFSQLIFKHLCILCLCMGHTYSGTWVQVRGTLWDEVFSYYMDSEKKKSGQQSLRQTLLTIEPPVCWTLITFLASFFSLKPHLVEHVCVSQIPDILIIYCYPIWDTADNSNFRSHSDLNVICLSIKISPLKTPSLTIFMCCLKIQGKLYQITHEENIYQRSHL